MRIRFRNRGMSGERCAPERTSSEKRAPGIAIWAAIIGLIVDAAVRDLKKPDSRLRALVGRLRPKIKTLNPAQEIGVIDADKVRVLDESNTLRSLKN